MKMKTLSLGQGRGLQKLEASEEQDWMRRSLGGEDHGLVGYCEGAKSQKREGVAGLSG